MDGCFLCLNLWSIDFDVETNCVICKVQMGIWLSE